MSLPSIVDAEVQRHLQELLLVLDLVAGDLALGRREKVSATARPWSEWAADPAAIMRAKFRAAIVSAVAPQSPPFCRAGFFGSGRGTDPWRSVLQQSPRADGAGLELAAC